MRRPNPPGTVLQALEPARRKLEELEERALRGEALAVVEMAASLSQCLQEVARVTMERVLDQAARAQPCSVPCGCGREAQSKGFEETSFVGRFGRVAVSRRRFACACGSSSFLLDGAWSLPAGDYTDDVREATDRLSCRLGFQEAVAELHHLWGIAPDASTAKCSRQADDARFAKRRRACPLRTAKTKGERDPGEMGPLRLAAPNDVRPCVCAYPPVLRRLRSRARARHRYSLPPRDLRRFVPADRPRRSDCSPR